MSATTSTQGTSSTRAGVYAESDRERLQRRSLRILLASQVLSGAGLAAGVTVGALLAEDMLGTTGLSGLPAALFTFGSAGAALAVGTLSDRRGRRYGLVAGYATGALGGAGVAVAAVIQSVPLLLAALLVYGAGTATNLQARYAGADLARLERRGTAISTILVGTTLGAVLGPNVVQPVGRIAASAGIPPLAGPFVLAALAYGLASCVLLVWLRPDPLLVARRLAAQQAAADEQQRRVSGAAAPVAQAVDYAALRLGAVGMVVTQLVMVAVMTMTPVHLRDLGHGLGATGLVIGLHIAAMFGPSPLTGRLADRYGPRPIAAGGGVALLGAGLLAATAPDDSVALLAVALILLGLGWNLGLLAGTTLVAGAVPIDGRARIQGRLDVAVALAGATGGLASGFVMASTSYGTLAGVSGVLAVAVLSVAVRPPHRTRPGPPCAASHATFRRPDRSIVDASDWDHCYASAQQWSDEPNALAAELLAGMSSGTAIDVAAGEGRMALWLAASGWKVTALDFSAVGLRRGQVRAEQLGLSVQWQVADATTADFGTERFDLVLVLYLHLPRAVLPDVLRRCADAVAPGGQLLVLGHDRDNVEHGVGGPPDSDVLYDVELLKAAATGFDIERAEQVSRQVGDAVALDTLLLARRS